MRMRNAAGIPGKRQVREGKLRPDTVLCFSVSEKDAK